MASAPDLVEPGRASTAGLRIEDSLLRLVLDSAAECAFVKDLDGRYIYLNRAAAAVTGRDPSEVLGHDDVHVFGPEVGRRMRAMDLEVIARGEAQTFEQPLPTPDGAARVLSATKGPVRDAAGRICGIYGLARDVTVQAREELVLRRKEALFEGLFRSPSVIKLLLDPVTCAVVDANDAALAFYGRSLEAMKALHVWDLDVGRPEEIVAKIAEMRATNTPHTEARHRRGDGEIRTVAIDAGSIEIDGTELILSLVHDVTDRVQAEAALRRSEARLEAMFEGVRDALLVADAVSGRLLQVNRRAVELLGRPEAELLGMHHLELYTPESAELANRNFGDRTRGRAIGAVEYEVLRPDGGRVPVEVNASAGQLPDGSRVMLGVFRDISERKQAERERVRLEEELRQAQKMEAIGQLAGGVAHDFNNILAAQMMNLGLLATRTDLPTEVHEALGEIMTGAQLAADLTRQLLAFSRRQVLEVERIELNGLLSSLLKMLRRVVGERVHVEFMRSAEALWIDADAGMVEQVVMNLVVNARDAMLGGGRVTIETRAVQEASAESVPGQVLRLACVMVRDDGCGMDEATLARVFEPFFTTKEPGKGTGLGLATVYGIVRQHRGRVEVESRVGEGTTFRVYWPLAEAERAKATPASRPEARGDGELIFLVEDEAPVRATLSRALRRLGYRIVEAESGDAALPVWARHKDEVRLLITDMVMPGSLSGLELARRLRREKRGLGVIVASGYSSEMVATGAPDETDFRYLGKPFELKVLAEVVEELLYR